MDYRHFILIVSETNVNDFGILTQSNLEQHNERISMNLKNNNIDDIEDLLSNNNNYKSNFMSTQELLDGLNSSIEMSNASENGNNNDNNNKNNTLDVEKTISIDSNESKKTKKSECSDTANDNIELNENDNNNSIKPRKSNSNVLIKSQSNEMNDTFIVRQSCNNNNNENDLLI